MKMEVRRKRTIIKVWWKLTQMRMNSSRMQRRAIINLESNIMMMAVRRSMAP